VNYTNSELQATLLFFGVIGIIAEIINLPFAIYKTFVIESHFGFNKSTPSLFIKDRIKSYLLAFILLGGLLSIFSFLYHAAGSNFWLYTWIVVSILMLLMSMFYTSLLLPIFNKLKPLPDGDLRNAIVDYCKKTGFGLKDVLVMDGSKRSSKANAFFSGIGKTKKIVLYDTLIENHTTDELVSVLAHETGHYKKKHTVTGLILSIAQMGLMLFLFSVFMESPEIPEAFGGNYQTIELGLLAFGILYTPVSILTGVLVNLLSRKHEFQADAYAAETSNGKALKEALIKLSVNNLSNLDPHPAYVFFYYSHPPLLQRIKALDTIS
jgi:STE24 endopeptidase